MRRWGGNNWGYKLDMDMARLKLIVILFKRHSIATFQGFLGLLGLGPQLLTLSLYSSGLGSTYYLPSLRQGPPRDTQKIPVQAQAKAPLSAGNLRCA